MLSETRRGIIQMISYLSRNLEPKPVQRAPGRRLPGEAPEDPACILLRSRRPSPGFAW